MKRVSRRLAIDLMDAPKLEGDGDLLTLRLVGLRQTRGGTVEQYTMTFPMPRYRVHQLLEQIRGMHERDLERIEREQKRRRTEAHLLSQDFKP